ncbi:MAG TPA: hypothetical protein VIU64_08395 [Polyangia bacterium]
MQRLVGLGVAVTLLFMGSTGDAAAAEPAPAPYTPGPPPVPSSPTAYPALGAVQPAGPLVYLRADNPRTTLQVQVDPELWSDVCIVPCARSVDPSRTYRVTGRRFVPTDPFTLPRSSGQVTIDARMGRRAENIIGKVMVPVGAGLAVAGVVLFVLGSRTGLSQSDLRTEEPRFRYHTYGAVGMVAGLGVSLGGALLWYRNSSTLEVQ